MQQQRTAATVSCVNTLQLHSGLWQITVLFLFLLVTFGTFALEKKWKPTFVSPTVFEGRVNKLCKYSSTI